MSFLLGVGASLLSAAGAQLVSYFEYEVEQAELEERQQQQQQQHSRSRSRCSPHDSPLRRISLPSHRLLSSPSPPTPPLSTTLLSSPTHSLLSTSSLFDVSSSDPDSAATCICTTDYTTAADYALTPFTLEFAAALSDHPSTFHSFPACCSHSRHFHLSALQLVHARRLLGECASFGRLRLAVREGWGVSEFEFWRVYFLLLLNVNTRERRQRSSQRRSQKGRRRRSARVEEECEQVDKENTSPKSTMTEGGDPGRAMLDEQVAEKRNEASQYKEYQNDNGAADTAESYPKEEAAVWAEVDRIIELLAAARSYSSPARPLAAQSNPSASVASRLPRPPPDALNDSACSSYYGSPSPPRPCGLFHRLTADEQHSAADLLALRSDEDGPQLDEACEQREVSRLVFSPTPSLHGSLDGDEWEHPGVELDDSTLELDVSVSCLLSDLDISTHSAHGSSPSRTVVSLFVDVGVL